MCGRYTNTLGPEELGKQLGERFGVQIRERTDGDPYNIAPTEHVLAVSPGTSDGIGEYAIPTAIPTADSGPDGITAGPEGAIWFTELDGDEIGEIGTGVPPASSYPPSLSSSPAPVGSGQACAAAQWATWTGISPSSSLYPFDGYQWLLDGAPIAGRTGPVYTPTAEDAGHQLACTLHVTYPPPLNVTAVARSASVTVEASC